MVEGQLGNNKMHFPRFLDSKKNDVLIVDEMGSEHIKFCLPKNIKFSILPTRNTIPIFLKISFFYNCTKRLIKGNGFKKAVLFASVEQLMPKVLITFIDNSNIMGFLMERE
jgi:hypothetical protein